MNKKSAPVRPALLMPESGRVHQLMHHDPLKVLKYYELVFKVQYFSRKEGPTSSVNMWVRRHAGFACAENTEIIPAAKNLLSVCKEVQEYEEI